MNFRRSGVLLVAVLLWTVTPAALFGQNVYGKISGTVSDSSGASIGDATVTLTNLDTNAKNQITTEASGNYSFVNILPGRYKIQSEKQGFKNFAREPIVVQIESGLKIDIVMPVRHIQQQARLKVGRDRVGDALRRNRRIQAQQPVAISTHQAVPLHPAHGGQFRQQRLQHSFHTIPFRVS